MKNLVLTLALGISDGTIQLRSAENKDISDYDGRWTLSEPLLVAVDGKETIDETLPPEPDSKINDSTLEGIDSNKDGIRDDIERFIAYKWDEPIEREAVHQYARGFGTIFFSDNSQQISSQLSVARSCVFAVVGAEQASNSLSSIRIEYLNTLQRSEKYFTYDESLSGNSFLIPIESTDNCDFSVEEL